MDRLDQRRILAVPAHMRITSSPSDVTFSLPTNSAGDLMGALLADRGQTVPADFHAVGTSGVELTSLGQVG